MQIIICPKCNAVVTYEENYKVEKLYCLCKNCQKKQSIVQ